MKATIAHTCAVLCGLALLPSARTEPPTSAEFALRSRLPGEYTAANMDLQTQLERILPVGTDLPTVLARLETVLRHRRLCPQILHGDRTASTHGPGSILLVDQPYRDARFPSTRYAKPPRLLTVDVDLGEFPYALGLLKKGVGATLRFDARCRLARIEPHVSMGLP